MEAPVLEELSFQNLKIAYSKLERKNKDLLDSMYYAAYVQQGLMPQPRHFRKLEQPYFLIYEPLNIIGGDFYWIGKKGDWRIYAVGDCTGHGISGAMLSSLAVGFLNYLVYSKNFADTGEILNELDKKWIETFNHAGDEEVNNDWMEISIVAYNTKERRLRFSGAGGSIHVLGADGIRRERGDHFPVGGWQIEKHRRFRTIDFEVKDKKAIYLYSDGFKDQFNELTGKKIGFKHFGDWLEESSILDCSNQSQWMRYRLQEWRGDAEQTDDICLLRIDL